jgi:hypothetical protein
LLVALRVPVTLCCKPLTYQTVGTAIAMFKRFCTARDKSRAVSVCSCNSVNRAVAETFQPPITTISLFWLRVPQLAAEILVP